MFLYFKIATNEGSKKFIIRQENRNVYKFGFIINTKLKFLLKARFLQQKK